jgi:sporadic carbohydrate cluster 2OG-Fe(II) oxygenase
MFLTETESTLTREYIRDGYIIRDAAERPAIDRIRSGIADIVRKTLTINEHISDSELLNNIHKRVSVDQLNQFRMQIIQEMNRLPSLRADYFSAARPYLDTIVGNELAMQLRVNLSIQMPNDVSSLLPVHGDTWSGDSPYEVVVWIPLVDCFNTKSMYILGPTPAKRLLDNFGYMSGKSSEDLYQSISKDVTFLDIKYGQVLLFDQALPHGNRINEETHTRWTMNCRFKAVFTPYGDKRIGEFFEPITLRAASRIGMDYKFPRLT